MKIEVDSYVMAAVAIGFMVPACLTACGTGYGIYWVVARSVRRSKIGTVIRHAMTRARPNKFTGELT